MLILNPQITLKQTSVFWFLFLIISVGIVLKRRDNVKKLSENDESLVYECPCCGAGTITINKMSAHRYGYCDTCDAAYIHYIPLPHQLSMHKNKHKIKLMLGG